MLKYSVQRKSFPFLWVLFGSPSHPVQMHQQGTVRRFKVKEGEAEKLMLCSL